MTPTEYSMLAARTESRQLHNDLVNSAALSVDIAAICRLCERLDDYKKALFYGKPMPPGYYASEAEYFPPAVPEADQQLAHGILGILSEAGELLDAYRRHRWPPSNQLAEKIDWRTTLLEELGDILWYIALLCRYADIPMEHVMRVNINKLMTRYPKGFTQVDANNRNRQAEQLSLNLE